MTPPRHFGVPSHLMRAVAAIDRRAESIAASPIDVRNRAPALLASGFDFDARELDRIAHDVAFDTLIAITKRTVNAEQVERMIAAVYIAGLATGAMSQEIRARNERRRERGRALPDPSEVDGA